MKKLLKYIKGYRLESVSGPFFKLLEALFELFTPLVVADIVDIGIAKGDNRYIFTHTLLLFGLAFIGLVCSVTAQYFAAKASVGFVTALRHALFEHIGRLSHTELDDIGTSTLITRMTSDMNQVQQGLNLTLRLLLRSPFVVFGAMIMAFRLDVPSAMIFVWTTILLFIVVFAIMLVCIPLYRRVQQRLDRVTALARENLTGSRVIRAFGREDEEIADFEKANSLLSRMQLFTGRISSLMNPLTFAMINIATVYLIHTGALRVDSGIITQGTLIALCNYMAQILVELIKLANLVINITRSLACARRISDVLDISPCITSGSAKRGSDPDKAVSFEDVALLYSNGADGALEHISFTARRGEVIGIIGGTGSGKSSLVNMIPRFYDASSGKVCVNGTDVREYDLDTLRSMIGIVPQKAVLFSGTIRENLLWGMEDADDAAIEEAVEVSQSADIIRAKGGLDEVIEPGGRNLSGGQRQRLTIARALVRRPEILILDDSASALDFATDARLRRALSELSYHPTVFIVSQRVSAIMGADRIIVLDDGSIAGMGTHSELMDGCGVYRDIYASQTGSEEAVS